MLIQIFSFVLIVNNVGHVRSAVLTPLEEKRDAILSNVDDPVDAGSELHAQMEEAAVKAMAIVDGAAQFAVEAEKEQTENLLPAEIRYKRDIVDDKLEEKIKQVELPAVKSEAVKAPLVEKKPENPNPILEKKPENPHLIVEKKPENPSNPLVPIPERVEEEEIEVESSKMQNDNEPMEESPGFEAVKGEELGHEEDEIDEEEIIEDIDDPVNERVELESKPGILQVGQVERTEKVAPTGDKVLSQDYAAGPDPKKEGPGGGVENISAEKIDKMIEMMNSLNKMFAKVLAKWDNKNSQSSIDYSDLTVAEMMASGLAASKPNQDMAEKPPKPKKNETGKKGDVKKNQGKKGEKNQVKKTPKKGGKNRKGAAPPKTAKGVTVVNVNDKKKTPPKGKR